MTRPFKQCSGCGKTWPDRVSFLSDPDLTIIGYQAAVENLDRGLFLFNHCPKDPECNSTIALQVGRFSDLYDGERYEDSYYDTEHCEGRCRTTENIEKCGVECRNAYVRDVLVIVSKHDKDDPAE